MRKVAGIVLFNEGKILLQHRTDDAPTHPSKWSFFGGAIEGSETSLTAVKRECFEELNYSLNNPKLIYKGEYCGVYLSLYIEEYKMGKELILNEGQGMGWFSLEEVKLLDVPEGYEIFYKIFKEIN